MQPILIVPPNALSEPDMKRLNDNGICTVVAKDPSAIKFLDPIPSAAERTKVEDAAIQLSRKLLSTRPYFNHSTAQYEKLGHRDVCSLYIECLVSGTSLDSEPTPAEREKVFFSNEKLDELRRLARQEAKEERQEAKKKALASSSSAVK